MKKNITKILSIIMLSALVVTGCSTTPAVTTGAATTAASTMATTTPVTMPAATTMAGTSATMPAATTIAGTSATMPAVTTTAGTTAGKMELTLQELAKYDGQNGQPAYIAVDGVIYDVSNEGIWKNGKHEGYSAGKDLTTEMKAAPHGLSKLKSVPIVGTIKK